MNVDEQVRLERAFGQYDLKSGESRAVKHVRDLGLIGLKEGAGTSRDAVTKRGWMRAVVGTAVLGVTAYATVRFGIPTAQDVVDRFQGQDAACEQLDNTIDTLKAQGITNGSQQMTQASVEFTEAGCAQPL
jgi:hypothetical protein